MDKRSVILKLLGEKIITIINIRHILIMVDKTEKMFIVCLIDFPHKGMHKQPYAVYIESCVSWGSTTIDHHHHKMKRILLMFQQLWSCLSFFFWSVECCLKNDDRKCIFTIKGENFWKQGLEVDEVDRDTLRQGCCYRLKEGFLDVIQAKQVQGTSKEHPKA